MRAPGGGAGRSYEVALVSAARLAISAGLSIAAVALCAASIASISTFGAPGYGSRVSAGCEEIIQSLGSSFPSRGLRVGDAIELSKMNPVERLEFKYRWVAGRTFDLPVRRGATHITVPLTLRSNPYLMKEAWTGTAIQLTFLLTGLLVLWRGRDAASLGLGIFFTGLAAGLGNSYEILPLWGAVLASVVAGLLAYAGSGGLFYMVDALARDIVRDRMLPVARRAFVAFWIVQVVAYALSAYQDLTVGCAAPSVQLIAIGAGVASISVALAVFGMATFRAGGPRRAQLRWMYLSICIGLTGPLINIVFFALNQVAPYDGLFALTIVIVPIGCTYAILRHRVIDIGFVLNRAIVYGTLTTLIVGILAVAEGLLAKAALGRDASLALELGVALALGLSFNALHKRIDLLVDRVFFRQKHEAEEALNRLAHESAYVEKPAMLLDRAIADLFAHSGATSAAIYERDADGYRLTRVHDDGTPPKIVDSDDPAFVRMRADLRDVELEDVASALGGSGLAVPMTVRGSLLGAVVLGPRTSGEPYAPDERALLLLVARELAAALNAMQSKDHADLVGALATGLIDAQAAQARAKQLRALG